MHHYEIRIKEDAERGIRSIFGGDLIWRAETWRDACDTKQIVQREYRARAIITRRDWPMPD